MNLLAIRLCAHDANISYFDGNAVHFYHPERSKQIKHFSYENIFEWLDEIRDVWGINYKSIDEIAIVFQPSVWGLPEETETFFPAVDIGKYKKFFPSHCKVWRINHHYAHALSHWPVMDGSPDVSIVIDGLGDASKSATVFRGEKIVSEVDYKIDGSIGASMCALARVLSINETTHHFADLAGKVMALQSYGDLDFEYFRKLSALGMSDLHKIFDPKEYLSHVGDLSIARHKVLNLARTVHERIGDLMVEYFKAHAKKDDVIYYSGGVAHNVLWNTKLKESFPNLVIAPHAGDDGLSIGAMEWLRQRNNLPPLKFAKPYPFIQTDERAEDPTDQTIREAAILLAKGKSVGWYQGNGEAGPRALGNRSILMNPTIENARGLMNSIKKREGYRPFGASVLKEYASDWFDLAFDNPHMLYVGTALSEDIKSITHIDGTCRVQTVDGATPFRSLLEKFYGMTGCPVLMNTSMNVAGKPIAASEKDALDLFNGSNLDCMIFGNNIYKKEEV